MFIKNLEVGAFLRKLILYSFGYLGRFLCFVAFLYQTSTLLNSMINPKDTLTGTERVQLEKIDFPLVFKICIKPGFDDEELKKMGYFNNMQYLEGRSIYNSSIFGWAGHTPDGGIVSNVSGEQDMNLSQVNN